MSAYVQCAGVRSCCRTPGKALAGGIRGMCTHARPKAAKVAWRSFPTRTRRTRTNRPAATTSEPEDAPTEYLAALTDTHSGYLYAIGAPTPDSGDGSARLTMEANEDHLNPGGAVHGGLLASLVDATVGAAVRSAVDQEPAATSQLTITYLRPGKPGLSVVSAKVSKRGESRTMCEAEVEQDGATLVHALATFALLES